MYCLPIDSIHLFFIYYKEGSERERERKESVRIDWGQIESLYMGTTTTSLYYLTLVRALYIPRVEGREGEPTGPLYLVVFLSPPPYGDGGSVAPKPKASFLSRYFDGRRRKIKKKRETVYFDLVVEQKGRRNFGIDGSLMDPLEVSSGWLARGPALRKKQPPFQKCIIKGGKRQTVRTLTLEMMIGLERRIFPFQNESIFFLPGR